MKNIHIVPTENNKSKIAYYAYKGSKNIKVGELGLQLNNLVGWSTCWNEQELYITSDEKIKDGDWCLDSMNNTIYVATKVVVHNLKSLEYEEYLKKIILTTDQDLIKDGVQSIPDDFLEWFVKNPSCEEVKVVKEKHHIGEEVDESYPKGFFDYKIIIPKEELFKHEVKVLTKEEVMEGRSSAYEFIDFDKQEPTYSKEEVLKDLIRLKSKFQHVHKYYPLSDKEIAKDNFDDIIDDIIKYLT